MAAKRGFCMRYTDIAIVGGGLAGSTAAAMLGRVGISTILVDPHPVYPCDFRVEKLSGNDQLARFFKTGIAESALRSTTHEGETGSHDSAICSTGSRADNTASCTTR
jgi:2-polyprenyl-6-methoxyphenol hydroxylase-like FAD-dependent oxidoreductase